MRHSRHESFLQVTHSGVLGVQATESVDDLERSRK